MRYIKTYESYLNDKKEFILLVGPPGIGKSFYTSKLDKDYDILTRDDIVVEICEREGLTYKDAYNRPNWVFDQNTGSYFRPEESDFYELDGKRYLRNFEKLGEVVDLPKHSFLRKWSGEGFKNVMDINNEIEDTFSDRLEDSIIKKHNIIIDMTNFLKKMRTDMISKLGKNRKDYIVKAVVFNDGGKGMEDTVIKINRKRDLELSKTNRHKELPDSLIRGYIENYEEPTEDEGIDEIIHVNTRKELENILNSDKQN